MDGSSIEKDAAFEATFKGFLRRQRTTPVPLSDDLNLTGQTAIVTGSNVGLGLSAARQLLGLKLSHLVMAVRSQAKGDAVAEQLRKDFPGAEVSVWILDMESYDSIRAFVEKCDTLPCINAVILNAGVMLSNYTVTKSTGHETTLQVNYLSTVYLTMLLIPVLRAKKAASISSASRPPTISIVGSDTAYSGANLKPEAPVLAQFDNAKTYGVISAYANSKLILMFFFARLAALVDPADVLLNMPNPGMTKGTGLGHDGPVIARKIFSVAQYFLARSPETGATNYLDAALTRGPETHGRFFSEWTVKPFPPLFYTEQGKKLGDILVDETMKELGPAGAELP
ncbi:retinol dehydrogenase 12 [Camillea tinctor]|nr:retinol dehydrogenase 12 [Camillea tinctor]